MNFKREWYVGFDKRDGQIRRIIESVNRSEINDFKWKNPDLLFIHKTRGLIIIEVDGSIHDKKTEATSRRNRCYEQAHVKFICLNLANIRATHRTLEEALDWKMEKLLREGHIGTEYDKV